MLALTLYQFLALPFISCASGLDKDGLFIILSTIAFQAEIESPMDNHTFGYHLWQDF